MTTKNFGFDFDLQMFAGLPANVTLDAASGRISANGSQEFSEGTPSVTWDTDTTTGYATKTATTTVQAYNFNGSSATVAGDAIQISVGTNTSVVTTVYNDSDVQVSESSSTTPADNTTVASPLWLNGGGSNTGSIVINANSGGTISSFTGQDYIRLTANGTNISLTGLYGQDALVFAPHNGVMNNALNDVAVNFTVADGKAVSIYGGATSQSNPTIATDNDVTAGALANQTWQISQGVKLTNGTSANALNITAVSDTAIITSDTYLSASVSAAGGAVAVGGTSGDTISFNGRTITGAGKANATLTYGNDTLVTAKVGTASSLSAGTVGGTINTLAAGATASITGAASVAAITAVDALAANGRWTLGSNQTTAQLGSDTVTFTAASNTITADSTGALVGGINFTAGTATLQGAGTHSNVTIGSNAAQWGFTSTDTVVAVFDTVGAMTLGADTSAVVSLNSSAAKTLAVGSNDILTQNSKTAATVAGGLVTKTDALAAAGSWTVRGGSGERSVILGSDTFAFQRADSANTYGVLTAGTSGNKAALIDDLSGNVSVTSATISGLHVDDNEWTISGAAGNIAAFDSLGTGASVTANSDLTVTASTDATVAVSLSSATLQGAKFNGVTITATDGDSVVGVQLEGATDTSLRNIAGITSLNSAATIAGDNYFKVNDVYTVQSGKAAAAANTKVSINSSSSQLVIDSVSSGDAYTVSGGNVAYNINSLASGGSTAVSINGAGVSVTAASANDATIFGTGSNPIVTLGGVNLEDTIKTSSADSAFTVRYNKPKTVSTSDTMIINNVTISAGNLTTDTALTVSVSESTGSSPRVTITGLPTGESATVTVSAGVYNVGSSSPVTINESVGYLYLDAAGNVTAEDESVAQIRNDRETLLHSLVSAQESLGANVSAFEAFKDIYNANFPSTIGAVAGFPTVTMAAADVTSVAATSGANIYGDGTLTAYPEQVTLQSFVNNSIVINKIEGVNSAHTVRTAVIDARGGSASVIALGMDSSADKFATNHTIYGSNRASTIMVGSQATGNHVVRAGSVGSYLYHNAGGQGGTASIFGGAGKDTIIAEKGDHVEGGAEGDLFYDSQAYEISDYSPESGDVIVATKLSSTARESFTPDNMVISGNTVAIAGGATITIGSNYDEATAVRAAIADATGSTSGRKYLMWAGTYESVLDASALPIAMMMISSQNGGAADTVIGSGSADSIYAGGNDTVNSGAGNDLITLKPATDTGVRGATVVLSAGKNEVDGWKQGFANDEGDNVLVADAAATTFRTRTGTVMATNGESVMSFKGLSEDADGGYKFIVGDQKVRFIGEGQSATVKSNDDLSPYYKADKAGEVVITSDVTTAFTADLNSSYFTNITSVNLSNNSRATVIGSSAAEKVTLAGDRDMGAHKSIMSGGGNDTIWSGGDSSVIAGNHFFFGKGNYDYSSGRDVINNFSYYQGKDVDPDGSAADVLHLGNYANFTGASVMSSRVELNLGNSATVVISDTTVADHVVRATFDDLGTVYNVKFGVGGSSQSAFTYDGETNYYWGNAGRGRDTLNVASNLSNVNIWLDNKDLDKVYYQGVGVINAASLTDTKATLVGNYSNSSPYATTVSNTIIGGGAGTQSSLWGGGGESNSLVGGEGYDEFFYVNSYGYTDSDGNRHGSNDVITNVTADDLVRLYDVTLDDIDLQNTAVTSTAITVSLKDRNGIKGGSLTVTGFGQETNFKLGDGSSYKAVVRGSNVGWE